MEVARLLEAGGARVCAADPLVDPSAVAGVRLVPATEQELAAADVVVVLTDHDVFDYDLVAACPAFVLDCRGRLAGRTATAVVERL